MPAVSVVIPTFNHGRYVLSAIESVFAQTFTDHEVIVINDGSPDNTAEVLRPLAEAGRIIYIEQANRGQAAARNRGIAQARGEFIALLDDDDVWPADKLEWQVAELRRRRELCAVGGSAVLIDADGMTLANPAARAMPVTFESMFDANPFISPGQTLIRTAQLRAIGGFDASIWGADDLDVWFRLARCGEIGLHERPALMYRCHNGNASANLGRMFRQVLEVVRSHASSAQLESRRELTIRGHRFIYRYAFARLMAAARHRLRRGDVAVLKTLIEPMACMARPALADPRLFWWFLCDLFPRRRNA